MQVSKISNQTSFNGICINRSKMGAKQQNLTQSLLASTIGHSKYDEICKKGVDIFFMPYGKNGVKARFLDIKSGEFYRDKFNKFIETHIERYGNIINKSDEILNKVCELADNTKTEQPEINKDAIFEGKTTLLKIKPSLHKEISKDYESFIADGLNKNDAKEQAVEIHLAFLPEDGFNFDY